MKYFGFLLVVGMVYYSCNTNPASTPENNSTEYNKLFNIESGSVNFEFWSATGSNLYYGYNDIGFKVFINGTEKNTGFFKFKPMMFHFPGHTGHSSPASPYFYYNSTNKLFTGYVCFSMISDSGSQWTGFYNYNNQKNLDSIPFTVLLSSAQHIQWDDVIGGNSYALTLLNPKTPTLGLNTFECLLHKSIDDITFVEVDSAQMYIKPWMDAMGHGSSSNVNPVSMGSGRYEGKANFTMPGSWSVYDSIIINNSVITKSPPPKFRFEVY